MQIINRLFPYPIYSDESDDYSVNGFEVVYNAESDDQYLKIDYQITIDNNRIRSLIDSDSIQMVLHIECPSTSFRKVYETDYKGSIEIESGHIEETVEICCLLIAKHDLTIDQNLLINEDYGSSAFNIKKDQIIGYYNADKLKIEKSKDDLMKPSSIFRIVKKKDQDLAFTVNLDDSKKIRLLLNEETFNQFASQQHSSYLPILHAMVVLPALTYVVEKIKTDEGRETYEDKNWYKAIMLQLKARKIDENQFKNKESIELAQILLKYPVAKGLNVLARGDDDE